MVVMSDGWEGNRRSGVESPYAKKLGRMLGKMAKHAQKMKLKGIELSVEKRRADALLCQMLPREVAEQLKMNHGCSYDGGRGTTRLEGWIGVAVRIRE